MAWTADWDNILDAGLVTVRPYVDDLRVAMSERQTVQNFATSFNDPGSGRVGWSIDYTDLKDLQESEDVSSAGLRTVTRFLSDFDTILLAMLKDPKLIYLDGTFGNSADGWIDQSAITMGENNPTEVFQTWTLSSILGHLGYSNLIQPSGTNLLVGSALKQRYEIMNTLTHKWYEAEWFIDESLSFSPVDSSLKCETDPDVIEGTAKVLAQNRMQSGTSVGNPIQDPKNVSSNGGHSTHLSRMVWPILFRARAGVCPPTKFNIYFYAVADDPPGAFQSDLYTRSQNNFIDETSNVDNEGSGSVIRSKIVGGGSKPADLPIDNGYVLVSPGVILDFGIEGGFTKREIA